MKRISQLALITVLSMALVSCGRSGMTEVSVMSGAYSPNGFVRWAAGPAVTEFKICVKRLRLEGDDGNAIEKEGVTEKEGDEKGYLNFAPGLIDLASGEAKDWG